MLGTLDFKLHTKLTDSGPDGNKTESMPRCVNSAVKGSAWRAVAPRQVLVLEAEQQNGQVPSA